MAIPKSVNNMLFGVDLAKSMGWSDVSAEVKNADVLYVFDNQTKTIFNKDPFAKKDPNKLLHYYKLPIEYKYWEQYPALKQKYKIGSHHKMDDIVFEVVEQEKNILHQEIIIMFKEAENIGMTGPNDNMMDGIKGNHDFMKDDLFDPNNPMDEVTLDKLTITVPKEDDYPFKVQKRSERSKMFYELTHGVSLHE